MAQTISSLTEAAWYLHFFNTIGRYKTTHTPHNKLKQLSFLVYTLETKDRIGAICPSVRLFLQLVGSENIQGEIVISYGVTSPCPQLCRVNLHAAQQRQSLNQDVHRRRETGIRSKRGVDKVFRTLMWQGYPPPDEQLRW